MLACVMSGSEEFPIGQSKFYVFFAASRRFPGTEAFLDQVAKEGRHTVSRHGALTRVPAVPGGRDLGSWTTGNYQLPEGAILKLFGQKKMSGDARPTIAVQYLRVRESAAMRRVLFRAVGWDKAAFQTVPVEGRFDLLTMNEALEAGVAIERRYEGYCAPALVGRLFSNEIISPELHPASLSAPRVVENAYGERVEVAVPQRRRGLSL